MKKIFLLCSIFFMFSCSKYEDSSSSSNSDFHPPDWIQGEWLQEGSLGESGVLFSFSANDFCFTSFGTTKQCQQEFVNLYRTPNNAVTVTENITTITYRAEIKYLGGQSIIYSFRKLSNTKIEWTAASGSVFIKQ